MVRRAEPVNQDPQLFDEMTDPDDERMWPLDVALVSLIGLILYMILGYLSFDDPRPLYNAWTYVVAVPLIGVGFGFALHQFASKYVQKSFQLGFLFSVFVHLLLVILAVRWVIFPHYFPEAFAGVKPDRSPIRKTVPEYLFQKPEETNAVTPDWSQPVDAETTSQVIPLEQRQMPPVKRSAPRMEIPQPDQEQPREPEKFLMKRVQPEMAQPQPAESPSRLARRRQPTEPLPQSQSSPQAPEIQTAVKPAPAESPAERAAEPAAREPQRQRSGASIAAAADAAPMQSNETSATPMPSPRSMAESMPTVGSAGLARQRSQRQRPTRQAAAGAAPTPPTVSIAKIEVDAERMLTPELTPIQRTSSAVGANVTLSPGEAATAAVDSLPTTGQGDLPQAAKLATMAGLPDAIASSLSRPRSAKRRAVGRRGSTETASPDSGAIAQMLAEADGADSGESGTNPNEAAAERALENATRSTGTKADASSVADLSQAADPLFDLNAPDGPAGLAMQPAEKAGIVPSDEPVEIAALDLTRGTRKRQKVGGPVTPAGLSIAAVEQFSRRVKRTNGGAAPAPAGMVGPATEEAIELGLAYLATLQNEDGSWSLQGHGDDVILQSDTAATGLCLLAYQGAGYTHRQHQYASTVAKGLKFLIDNQRTNGDLYRRENPLSDQNVAFYSHGIASLALCEAYGMTQDPELRDPAQMCLNYVEATQHKQRGGWRYTPQVSSDTSVTGWMMMALKSGELSGLTVSPNTYAGIDRWLELAKASPTERDRYRYNPFAPNTPAQAHGRRPTPTMTAVGILMRMYSGWSRENEDMQSAAAYIAKFPPSVGTSRAPQRDTYYWYYATQVMFHMGGEYWDEWNQYLNPVLIESQIKRGPEAGSWDPELPVPDRWSAHGGRLYVTTMNLLNLEVYYRHLPIYEETGAQPTP
ncbi:hypothetical protein LOC71_09920 [Rhodopirellula sp. JC740]|uniref:Squalene cyclase C-terminal domain-containing protein n=2 Tax=Rhodopirellula halodulae TaxID=2894198 RepID=A0ABS8NGC7_9BACT|nr:hypothetical protein [Rhodopirellula sp. JC740]MCC9642591.1 hypothetical protein [Rhodopirellula sp. JC740]